MAYAVKLEQFEGPLALLLEMIETEKLDISQLSLGKVTDSYLRFLDENPNIPAEELADFLVIASRLLLIKSKLLLPYLTMGDDEDESDLESQLRIYKEYLDASKIIEKMIGKRRFLFVHEKLPKVEIGFAPPKKLKKIQIRDLFLDVIKRLDEVVRIPEAVLERTVSIHDKINHIRKLIDRASKVSFKKLVESAESRTEIVVSFLALLELIKQKAVTVNQDNIFEDITINKVDEESS